MTGSHISNDTPQKVDDLHWETMGTDQVVTSLVADWGIFQRQGSNLGHPGSILLFIRRDLDQLRADMAD
jgi:hypothetical protein